MGMRRRFPDHGAKHRRGQRWKALRQAALRRDGWQCVQCGARGRLEVDHIRPVKDAPELAFDLSNLQVLCPSCHTKKTRIEAGFSPPDPKRAAWREAVSELEAKRNRAQGEAKCSTA